MSLIILLFIAWFVTMPLWLSISITVIASLHIVASIANGYHKAKMREELEETIKKLKE